MMNFNRIDSAIYCQISLSFNRSNKIDDTFIWNELFHFK